MCVNVGTNSETLSGITQWSKDTWKIDLSTIRKYCYFHLWLFFSLKVWASQFKMLRVFWNDNGVTAICCFDDVGGNPVYHPGPKSVIGVHLAWALMATKAKAYDSNNF